MGSPAIYFFWPTSKLRIYELMQLILHISRNIKVTTKLFLILKITVSMALFLWDEIWTQSFPHKGGSLLPEPHLHCILV
jgi:hypothetical protein